MRRCSVLAWPVPSLSVPTPLTAANSVQVRGLLTEASPWGWGDPDLCLGCVMGTGKELLTYQVLLMPGAKNSGEDVHVCRVR